MLDWEPLHVESVDLFSRFIHLQFLASQFYHNCYHGHYSYHDYPNQSSKVTDHCKSLDHGNKHWAGCQKILLQNIHIFAAAYVTYR